MTGHDAGSHCYGIDIGGSKIELVAFDAAMQATLRQRIDTPRTDYAAFLDAVCALVDDADGVHDSVCRTIGIGLPGVRDHASGRQLSANVPALTGQRVAADLEARLQRPLRIGNDLQCFALSEANGGAAAGYPSMIGAILGTGAGGGYCIDGRLVVGHNGIAGEWGHWSIPASLLAKHDLQDAPLHLRISGCPNGCSRPYLGEIALVGKAPGRYNLMLGADHRGQRLNTLHRENIDEAAILAELDTLFARYANERMTNQPAARQRFGDFLVAAGIVAIPDKDVRHAIPLELVP